MGKTVRIESRYMHNRFGDKVIKKIEEDDNVSRTDYRT